MIIVGCRGVRRPQDPPVSNPTWYLGSCVNDTCAYDVSGVRQADASSVVPGRKKARAAALAYPGARTVVRASGARIMQGRANGFEENVMPSTPLYVGIDVAKAQLDVAVRPIGDR